MNYVDNFIQKFGHFFVFEIVVQKNVNQKYAPQLELVFKELNHFGVIADLFHPLGGYSGRFVLFCSF